MTPLPVMGRGVGIVIYVRYLYLILVGSLSFKMYYENKKVGCH